MDIPCESIANFVKIVITILTKSYGITLMAENKVIDKAMRPDI